MEPTQSPKAPARTLFMVVTEDGKYSVYRNNILLRYGFLQETAAKTYCESKARSYSHANNAVMRTSTFEAGDVGPYKAQLGQDVWLLS